MMTLRVISEAACGSVKIGSLGQNPISANSSRPFRDWHTLREVERGRPQAGRWHSRAREVSTAWLGLRAFREHGRKWDVLEPGHLSAHRSLPRPRFHLVDRRGHAGRLRPLLQSVQSSLRSGRVSRRTTDRDQALGDEAA